MDAAVTSCIRLGSVVAHPAWTTRPRARASTTPSARRANSVSACAALCWASALSGVPGPNPSTICLLLGSAKPFSAARLAQLYPSRAAYLQQFTADVDATIKAGFALPEDRSALLAFAEPLRIAG